MITATHCTLHTTVGCIGNEECTAKSHSIIKLLGPVRDVIVRPARHHYKPGETIAYVTLSDPAGTKVVVWDQLSLEEGLTLKSAVDQLEWISTWDQELESPLRLYRQLNSIIDVVCVAQQGLSKITQWLQNNLLTINILKSK
ncbi:unnamed protein product [Leptidea sinapis]|uniref:Uncharacterized protein n=1 Tax=Leptidea sinapis TaxID=189913 RepID=A0A5E4Q219_9NEOP|nr:unnamed protein product [Leptidea sinapis]